MKTFVKNVIFLKSKLTHLRKKYFAENVPNGTGKHCKISCRSVQLFCIYSEMKKKYRKSNENEHPVRIR